MQCWVSWDTRTARGMIAAGVVNVCGQVIGNWQQDVTAVQVSIWHVLSLVYQSILAKNDRSYRNIIFRCENENASHWESDVEALKEHMLSRRTRQIRNWFRQSSDYLLALKLAREWTQRLLSWVRVIARKTWKKRGVKNIGKSRFIFKCKIWC